MARNYQFARDSVLPSFWANRIQDLVAATRLSLRLVNATTVEVPAGPVDGAVAITLQGRWRVNEATVQRAHPGGTAGEFVVWATARDNQIISTPDPFTDQTVYTFDLAIIRAPTEPTLVAGTVELWREIGRIAWDGSQITSVRQTAPPPVGMEGLAAALKPSQGALAGTEALRAIGTGAAQAAAGNDTRFPAGADIVNADVGAAAAIAESKLALASDAAAATPSRRSLGTGAAQAAPGNDTRFPAGADIVNADIAAAAAIAESKLALASDAAAATASRRTLGTGAAQAAPGNAPGIARYVGTVLPSSGVTGEVIVYNAGGGCYWQLMWDATLWRFIGGARLAEDNGSLDVTDTSNFVSEGNFTVTMNSNVWKTVTGAAVVIPRAGVYTIQWGCGYMVTDYSAKTLYLSISGAGLASSVSVAALARGEGTVGLFSAADQLDAALTAGTLSVQFQTSAVPGDVGSSSKTSQVRDGWINVTPIHLNP